MKKNKILKIVSSIVFLTAVVVLANTYSKRNEENIYLNNGIDENGRVENSVDEKEEEAIENEEIKYIDIVSLGNLIIHQSQINGAKNENGYDFSPSFQYIKEMVSEADISLGILEGALAGGEPTGYPIFNSPDEVIDSLRDTGIDVVNYANNHIYDYDDEGLQRTIEITKEKGLDVLGVKSTEEEKSYLVKEVDGVKIGFASYVFETAAVNGYKTINSNPVSINSENLINTFNYNDLESFYNRIASEISAMKAEGVKFIIASMHWGEEYNTYIEATQNEIAKKLNELGVDIILGGHPHVIQPYEIICNESGHSTFVIYSQGNSLSNQSEQEIGVAESEDGIMIKFTLEKKDGNVSLKEYKIIPTWVYKEEKGDGTYYHKIIPVEEALANPEEYGINSDVYARLENSLNRTKSILGIQ
ncbi:capA domain protein [Clostridium sp. CAG:221]|uniref:CapA family protein n=1 Tax=Clostridium sp. CAG:221 TaxID=1262780 RepID=UPI00033704D6|nr:CapA family protein [Clostridium sp. CAG:221]CDB14756.1 capA domain protein [Clostridium sp. CAG:221]